MYFFYFPKENNDNVYIFLFLENFKNLLILSFFDQSMLLTLQNNWDIGISYYIQEF